MADLHVVSQLKQKRAEVSGIIRDVQRRLSQYQIELDHIDAVIKLFAPGFLPESIPPRRPYIKRTPGFHRGEMTRRVMDILRGANGIMLDISDIALMIMRDKEMDLADVEMAKLLKIRILEVMKEKRKRSLVHKSEKYGENKWGLTK